MKRILTLVTAAVLLAACGSSSTAGNSSGSGSSPGTTGGGGTGVSAYDGKWTGTWNNTTFGSSGGVTFDVTSTGTTASIAVTLTGNVFGGSPPATTHINGTYYSATGFTFDTSSDPGLGNCHVTIDLGTILSADCKNVPSARVSEVKVDGSWKTAAASDFHYQVLFRDGTAPAGGTVHIAKS
jgi:hypothetical protein